MSDVAVTWVQGDQFVASGSGGHSIVLDAPAGRATWQGFKPSELLLAALGGCTAVDVIDILRKQRQPVSGLCVTVRGQQREEHPHAFERIAVHYEVRGHGVAGAAVARAIGKFNIAWAATAMAVRLAVCKSCVSLIVATSVLPFLTTMGMVEGVSNASNVHVGACDPAV